MASFAATQLFDQASAQPLAGLLHLLAPLIHERRARLDRRLRASLPAIATRSAPHAGSPGSGRRPFALELAEQPLFAALPSQLLAQLSPARMAALGGAWRGSGTQAGYQRLLEQLGRPEQAAALLEQHPALIDEVTAVLDRWLAVGGDLLERLAGDWPALCRELWPYDEPGALLAIECAYDETLLLCFERGVKLAYLPRPLEAELAFQRLLAWLNQQGAQPCFHTTRLLGRGSYGWGEALLPRAPATPLQARRYYQRYGATLALLHALGARVGPATPLIPLGEYPILLGICPLDLPLPPSSAEAALPSVLSSGLLPACAGDPCDLPALELSQSPPALAGHRDDLLAGFESLYTLLQKRAGALLGSGLLTRLSGERQPQRSRWQLEQLGPSDYSRQCGLICAALSALPDKSELATCAAWLPLQRPTLQPRAEALELAEELARQLEELAVETAHGLTWEGLIQHAGRPLSIAPLGPNLGDGLPGPILFLAQLGALTGRSYYTSMAQDALAALRAELARSGRSLRQIGAFQGWGGLLYLLTRLSSLWGEQELLEEACMLVERIGMLLNTDERYDLAGGAAGAIGALLAFDRQASSPRATALALRCGEHLLAAARPMPAGAGWATPGGPHMAGMAHGAAGIAAVLLRLSEHGGAERLHTLARDAITYERSLYHPDQGNWTDLRHPAGALPVAWCHGAAGIGLARLATLSALDDGAVRAEIRAAVETTLAFGFGANHSLCHGDLGNLELLRLAGERLDQRFWRQSADQHVARMLADMRERGWRCGAPAGAPSLGLLTGLSGIGYGLLRIAAPERVPNVLLLE